MSAGLAQGRKRTSPISASGFAEIEEDSQQSIVIVIIVGLSCDVPADDSKREGVFMLPIHLLMATIFVAASSPTFLHADEKGGPSGAAKAMQLLVPAYFYPANKGLKEWDRLLDAASATPIAAIVNPASGPGKEADPNYVKIIERAAKTRIQLVGYVATSYGKRSLDDVKADVDRWVQLYPGVCGIFVDEQASGADKVDYYLDLCRYVRKKKSLKRIIANPGTICAEGYFSKPTADTICIFEGPKPFAGTLPVWGAKIAPERIAILSYQVGTAKEMLERVRTAKKLIGFVYVTDAAGANPWDRLPSYWADEIEAIRELAPKQKE
jgi:hypothetical protein